MSPRILERELLLASESSQPPFGSLQGQTQHPELRRRRRRRETLKGMRYSSSCCLGRLCQNVGVKMTPPPPCVCTCVALEAFFSLFLKKGLTLRPHCVCFPTRLHLMNTNTTPPCALIKINRLASDNYKANEKMSVPSVTAPH